MTLSYKEVPFYQYFSLNCQKVLRHLMQNQFLSIDAELEKDQFKGIEKRENNLHRKIYFKGPLKQHV